MHVLVMLEYNGEIAKPVPVQVKALANGFNIAFNMRSILLNAVEWKLNYVERGVANGFQQCFQ